MCIIFYITHLGVQYEIYPAHIPFDLRCQGGILCHIDYVTLLAFQICPDLLYIVLPLYLALVRL